MDRKLSAFAALIICSTPAFALPSKPLTAAHKSQIAAAVKEKLKDADSAKFRWPAVQDFGLYCGWVNAKNSYGGYTGFQPFMVIGGVGDGPKSKGNFDVDVVEIGGTENGGIVQKMCTKQGFDMGGPPSE